MYDDVNMWSGRAGLALVYGVAPKGMSPAAETVQGDWLDVAEPLAALLADG